MRIFSLHTILLAAILFCCLNLNAEGGKGSVAKSAENEIFIDLSECIEKSLHARRYLIIAAEILDSFLDSVTINNRDIVMLRELRQLYTVKDIQNLIFLDSLTSFEIIPSRLISVLNNYLINQYLSVEDEVFLYSYDCEIPASEIYLNSWNTRIPNPYPRNFADSDTLIHIKLVNDAGDFNMPGEGRVSSRFGWRNSAFHAGIDLAVYHGLPIYSVFPGVVRFARTYGGYGRLVIVRHDNGLETFYAHLSRIHVKTGQRVNAGDMIGRSGNSGNSNGTHLHFEMRYKGLAINPSHLICFEESKLKLDECVIKKISNNYFVYSEDAIIYKVQRGDYLYKIAEEFGTSVNKICESNGISRRSGLRVGQVLLIYM